jgi:hypothetical protein
MGPVSWAFPRRRLRHGRSDIFAGEDCGGYQSLAGLQYDVRDIGKKLADYDSIALLDIIRERKTRLGSLISLRAALQ